MEKKLYQWYLIYDEPFFCSRTAFWLRPLLIGFSQCFHIKQQTLLRMLEMYNEALKMTMTFYNFD